MIKKVIVLSFISLNILCANNLDNLIKSAIENKLVKASKHQLEASKLDYESLKNSYKPSLNLSSKYSSIDNETPSMARNGLSSSISLNYNLYDGNKKENNYKALESEVQKQDYNLKDLKNRIALNVINLYFSYLSFDESKKAKVQEVNQLRSQYKKQERFYQTGTIAIDELEKILSRLENANVSIQEIELDKQTILHNLEYLVGKRVDVINGGKIKSFPKKESILRADIKALEYELKNSIASAKVVKSEKYPQINLNNTFTHNDNDFDNEAFDSGVDNQNILSVNLSWKLYDFGTVDKKYEAAMKRYLALKSEYEYEKNKMDTDLKLSYKSYDIAKLKISSAKASLKSANTTFKAIKDKYENNIIDNVAFLEALSEKYNALSILKTAEYDLELKRANIIYNSGYDLENFIR